ncbi:MAG: L,D-transpeptidase [Anaerolineales bacterium]
MTQPKDHFSRRDFLKLAGLGLGALALRPFVPLEEALDRAAAGGLLRLPDFPQAERLARNCVGRIPIKARPDVNSATVEDIYEDAVLPWLREVVAETLDINHYRQRWVETPRGYIYSTYLQPCRNLPNVPLTALTAGSNGFWAEVTVPYADCYLENDPASPYLKYLTAGGFPIRVYYSQVFWVDQIRTTDSGVVLYRVSERYGSYGDVLWAEGAAFRPISEADIAPITPEIDTAEKRVVVNLNRQTLSCFEQGREVYFCRVSTGVGDNSTPVGEFATWRKTISIHMAGGTVDAGYDTPGIAWTTLFHGQGVAIHATFWHNQFGEKRSHGCVNCLPEDAKWIWRWTAPVVPLEPGDVTWDNWQTGSTHVIVEERY